MANQPLLDLREFDLDHPQYLRPDIEAVIPHRGAISQLDSVVWIDDNNSQGIALKHVRDDEFWVEGHIPGRPIMPGVLMVEAAAQLASFLFYRRTDGDRFAGFTRIDDTTFRGIVEPGQTLVLIVQEVKFNPKRFVMRAQGVVEGEVVFEGTITVMVFPHLGPLRAQTREAGASR